MKKKNELLWEHYEKNFDKYVKRASRVLDDWHYGEDCVQEAYESGLRYLHTFSGDNLDGWFYVVYVNTLRKYLRFIKTQGMNREIKMSDHPMFPSEMVDKYKGLIKKEIKESKKKDRIKDLLMLYFVLGYRGKELEFLSGMSVSSIHTQANRFKQLLMEKYEVFKKE